MDGKQARRTKSSSALGELFDHGVDSWASFLFPICIFSVISKVDGDGMSPMTMHILLLSTYVIFIGTHWEKYNTKVLFLPWAHSISMWVSGIVAESYLCDRCSCYISVDNNDIFVSVFLLSERISFQHLFSEYNISEISRISMAM